MQIYRETLLRGSPAKVWSDDLALDDTFNDRAACMAKLIRKFAQA